MNALVSIETLAPTAVFSPGGIDGIVSKIEAEVRAEAFDVTTLEGRDRIKSVAYKVARSKTALDDMGKELVAGIKAQAGAIDADRRTARDRLDALKDEVRAPLTAWEQAEAERVAGHSRCLATLVDATRFVVPPTAEMIRGRLAEIAFFGARDWQEFQERAEAAYTEAKASLDAMETAAEQRESDAAELEALRKEKAERDARDQAETAAKAKAEAERIAAEQAELRQQEQEASAARQAEEAAARAVEAERQRVAKAKAAKEAADRKRQQDEAHRTKVHAEITAALMAVILEAGTGRADTLAARITDRIAHCGIPALSITY